jgi:hypothetical protein
MTQSGHGGRESASLARLVTFYELRLYFEGFLAGFYKLDRVFPNKNQTNNKQRSNK